MESGGRSGKDAIKVDQMMRILFRLSKRPMIDLINGLFGERFTAKEVISIRYGNAEFISDEYERIVGDLFLQLETTRGVFHYHVEFQTLNDQSMVIRMFRYGLEKAIELALSEGTGKGNARLMLPRQIVVFLEENEAIGDELLLQLQSAENEVFTYRVPVIRYWTYSPHDLQALGIYALLPLQVFRLRKKMRQIISGDRPDEEKRHKLYEAFGQLKDMVKTTLAVINDLHADKKLPTGDMDRMLRALSHILGYLYRNYGELFEQTRREVRTMIKTFIDPKVLRKGRALGRKEGIKEGIKEGKIEVARNMLNAGMELDAVVRITGLSLEELQEVGKHI